MTNVGTWVPALVMTMKIFAGVMTEDYDRDKILHVAGCCLQLLDTALLAWLVNPRYGTTFEYRVSIQLGS